ncbi:MAG: hypothetical protein M2R45_00525 [Verrucomicrobia subdivision 3 bacterium]|nr:hypothetical protein [Limisphaerales bacterium]MCS1413597.1 hypothetical protein [Limisphaerales bacterium]
MTVTYFKTAKDFRQWLRKNGRKEQELWVGFYRKDTGKGGITYSEALDEALCFGWIDGVRRKVDDLSYTNRFTPRKPNSVWSEVNLARVEVLRRKKKMTKQGLKPWRERNPDKIMPRFATRPPTKLAPEFEKTLRANPKARAHFEQQPPGYRKQTTLWIMSAKLPETRQRRFDQLLAASQDDRRLGQVAIRKPDQSS